MRTARTHDQIATRAFQSYVSRGNEGGNAADDSYRAESSLRAEMGCAGEHCKHPEHGTHEHGAHDTRRRHGA